MNSKRNVRNSNTINAIFPHTRKHFLLTFWEVSGLFCSNCRTCKSCLINRNWKVQSFLKIWISWNPKLFCLIVAYITSPFSITMWCRLFSSSFFFSMTWNLRDVLSCFPLICKKASIETLHGYSVCMKPADFRAGAVRLGGGAGFSINFFRAIADMNW